MADLSVFSSEDKDATPIPITPTKKNGGGKQKLGSSSLATTKKGSVATLPNSDTLQVVEMIERQYGADFLHLAWRRLQDEAEQQAIVFDQTQALEEIATLGRLRNIEAAKNLGREKANYSFKLRELQKLKNEAVKWMQEDNFIKMVETLHALRFTPNQIASQLKKDANTLNLELIDFKFDSDGGYDIPTYRFIYESEIENCKKKLAELGVELASLKNLGVEIE